MTSSEFEQREGNEKEANTRGTAVRGKRNEDGGRHLASGHPSTVSPPFPPVIVAPPARKHNYGWFLFPGGFLRPCTARSCCLLRVQPFHSAKARRERDATVSPFPGVPSCGGRDIYDGGNIALQV